jgi:hypothetical protein
MQDKVSLTSIDRSGRFILFTVLRLARTERVLLLVGTPQLLVAKVLRGSREFNKINSKPMILGHG